jgi:predicted O-methyltransferase YrrM
VAYAAIFDEIQDSSLDFVLIDGLFRGLCAEHAIRCVKPSGMIIIDNVNWYLPSDSRSPGSVKRNAKPASDWTDFYEATHTWRRIWTNSGVTDTAIYFKPCP